LLSVSSSPTGGSISITLGTSIRSGRLGIYDLRGKLIADLSSQLGVNGTNISWNVNRANVKSGTYIVKLQTAGSDVSEPVWIMR
jgi:hypothetical protein